MPRKDRSLDWLARKLAKFVKVEGEHWIPLVQQPSWEGQPFHACKQMVYYVHHKRKPVGRLFTCCSRPDCVNPSHVVEHFGGGHPAAFNPDRRYNTQNLPASKFRHFHQAPLRPIECEHVLRYTPDRSLKWCGACGTAWTRKGTRWLKSKDPDPIDPAWRYNIEQSRRGGIAKNS